MVSIGCDSPTGIDAPLDYLTVENYAWPKPAPAKRARLDDQERRRRHCECQKRFLARKRREFEQLPRQVAQLELQLRLVKAMREAKALQAEQARLQLQLEQTRRTEGPSTEPGAMHLGTQGNDDDEADMEALVSLDVDALMTEIGLPW